MTILDQIVVKKRKEIAETKSVISVKTLEESPFFNRACYSLKDFLLDVSRTGIIAEFKRASPSKGIINDRVNVAEVTRGYNSAGASALSVLTDESFFKGSKQDLTEARKANDIPVLRKEFMLDEYQILEAKALGADIILLIAAILSPQEIQSLSKKAKGIGISVLLEVHDRIELQRSICDTIDAVGVNNRNLADFSVSVDRSYELVDLIPDSFMKISESGISNTQTIIGLKKAGFNGFLIGENFMKQDDPAKAMKEFVNQLKS